MAGLRCCCLLWENSQLIGVEPQVLAALRFARARGVTVLAELSPRRFLEAAVEANDDVIFYSGSL